MGRRRKQEDDSEGSAKAGRKGVFVELTDTAQAVLEDWKVRRRLPKKDAVELILERLGEAPASVREFFIGTIADDLRDEFRERIVAYFSTALSDVEKGASIPPPPPTSPSQAKSAPRRSIGAQRSEPAQS